MERELVRYVVNKDIMPLYISTAETYMNLGSGALVLTVVFREKIAGAQPGTRINANLLLCWLSFLLAIGASALYQYFAVKFLDSVSCWPGTIQHFEHLVRNPGTIYGVMLVFFFAGAGLLVVTGWRQLPGRHG